MSGPSSASTPKPPNGMRPSASRMISQLNRSSAPTRSAFRRRTEITKTQCDIIHTLNTDAPPRIYQLNTRRKA